MLRFLPLYRRRRAGTPVCRQHVDGHVMSCGELAAHSFDVLHPLGCHIDCRSFGESGARCRVGGGETEASAPTLSEGRQPGRGRRSNVRRRQRPMHCWRRFSGGMENRSPGTSAVRSFRIGNAGCHAAATRNTTSTEKFPAARAIRSGLSSSKIPARPITRMTITARSFR